MMSNRDASPDLRSEGQTTAIVSALLAFAFLLRVLGQALVAFFHVDFLPPMAEWYSGLLPYPLLLPIQLLILAVQAKIAHDLWRGQGFFAVRRPRAGRFLCRFSYVYFAVMLLRYVRDDVALSRAALAARDHSDILSLGVGGLSVCVGQILPLLRRIECGVAPGALLQTA